jgi:hypothetical protein
MAKKKLKRRDMHDNDLNELTHVVADFLQKFLPTEIDRCSLNDKLESICNEYTIFVKPD